MIKELSRKYFGTTDYQGVLSVLAASDMSVKAFLQECHENGLYPKIPLS